MLVYVTVSNPRSDTYPLFPEHFEQRQRIRFNTRGRKCNLKHFKVAIRTPAPYKMYWVGFRAFKSLPT